MFFLKWFCLLRQKAANNKKIDSLKTAEFARFDFATIKSATENFSVNNKLGEGGFGVVYKGTLNTGKEIAIKAFHGHTELSTEVFVIESRVVARVRHTNLVKLYGFCVEGKLNMLISEYVPNASLDCFLSDHSKRALMNWETRYKIIQGIAEGLEYLHQSFILHYGLKTSNILLDEEMNPKIADFAVTKLFERAQLLKNTCASVGTDSAVGTYIYIAPEYCFTGRFSAKSDVYSFGVIVLLTLIDPSKGKSSKYRLTDALLIQARRLWDEDRLSELMDPVLSVNGCETDVIRYIQVGVLCVQRDAEHRPSMREAVLMLAGKLTIPLPSAPVLRSST